MITKYRKNTALIAAIVVLTLFVGNQTVAADSFDQEALTRTDFLSVSSTYLEQQNAVQTVDTPAPTKLVIIQDSYILSQNTPPASTTIKSKSHRTTVRGPLYIAATGYSSTADQTDDSPFITANGMHVYDGTIAANFLPFKTQIKIPELYGDKIFTVEDRMNPRYSNRIDIWFPDRNSAIQFGVRKIKIEVL